MRAEVTELRNTRHAARKRHLANAYETPSGRRVITARVTRRGAEQRAPKARVELTSTMIKQLRQENLMMSTGILRVSAVGRHCVAGLCLMYSVYLFCLINVCRKMLADAAAVPNCTTRSASSQHR